MSFHNSIWLYEKSSMKNRRALIDATAITHCMKGVGRYAWQLCEALLANIPLEGKLFIVVFQDSSIDFPESPNLEVVQIPNASEFKLGMHVFPALLNKYKVNVFIRPADKIGKDYGIPTLTVCHDVNPWIWQQCPPRPLKRRMIDATWEYLRGRAMRHSQLVVCNSQFVRDGVVEHFSINRESTAIGYCGVDSRIPELASTSSRSDLAWIDPEDDFLLTFATADPREGYDILPKLFAAAKQSGYAGKLVVAGSTNNPDKARLQQEFRDLRVDLDVVWVPFLGEAELVQLAALYRFADFYLETSRHEGFGMQLVEAMACGTTCFSSRRGALTEVGGGFCLPLDIGNPTSAGSAIADAWHANAHLRNNSKQVHHALGFDWRKTRQIVSDFAWGQ